MSVCVARWRTALSRESLTAGPAAARAARRRAATRRAVEAWLRATATAWRALGVEPALRRGAQARSDAQAIRRQARAVVRREGLRRGSTRTLCGSISAADAGRARMVRRRDLSIVSAWCEYTEGRSASGRSLRASSAASASRCSGPRRARGAAAASARADQAAAHAAARKDDDQARRLLKQQHAVEAITKLLGELSQRVFAGWRLVVRERGASTRSTPSSPPAAAPAVRRGADDLARARRHAPARARDARARARRQAHARARRGRWRARVAAHEGRRGDEARGARGIPRAPRAEARGDAGARDAPRRAAAQGRGRVRGSRGARRSAGRAAEGGPARVSARVGRARARARADSAARRAARRREAKAVAPVVSVASGREGAKRRDVVLSRFGEKLRGSARAKCSTRGAEIAERHRHRAAPRAAAPR